jgi:hypothetical protein
LQRNRHPPFSRHSLAQRTLKKHGEEDHRAVAAREVTVSLRQSTASDAIGLVIHKDPDMITAVISRRIVTPQFVPASSSVNGPR